MSEPLADPPQSANVTDQRVVDLFEDHEAQAGEVIEDPWIDPAQRDWDNQMPVVLDDDNEEPA